VKNTRKCLKVITTLALSLSVISAGFIQPVMADAATTTTNSSASSDTTTTTTNSSTSSDTATLGEMTFAQLNTSAKPMPDDGVTNTILYSNNYMTLKSQKFIPQDGNIYYTKSVYVDPKSITASGANTENTKTITDITYYKFLNMEPGRYPFVNYNSYYWEFKDGILQSSGITTESISDETIYTQLSGGLPYALPASGLTDKRLNTMFDMANELNSGTLDNVVIASGTGFADALSGTVLASKLKAPILFMNTPDDAQVYEYVNTNLKKGGRVYILGGEGSISSEISDKFIESGFIVDRLGGTDRYDTCSQVNDQLNVAQGTPVIIVSGENFPDALSISSVAAIKGYPILLTESNSIPAQTISQLNKIKPSKIYVIGGSGVISDDTFNTLKSYSSDVSRIFGADRYETSLNIAKTFTDISNNSNSTLVLATGTDFKDALAGSTVAAKYGAPILLIGSDITNAEDYIKTSAFKNLIILGDTNSISSDTESSLSN
jgi:putative cell wall-binding protein